MYYWKILFTFIVLLFSITARAEQDTEEDFGVADPEHIEFNQFEYMRGKWIIDMQMSDDEGQFQKLPNQAFVHGFYHSDGRSFQTVFTTEDGFFSTDIRAYNFEMKKWQIMFLNATAQRWHQFEASYLDNQMTTIIPGGYSGKEEFDIKAIDRDITKDGYIKHVYYSYDGGLNWSKKYIMSASRLGSR